VATYRDPAVRNDVSPEEFATLAQKWIEQGVQIIGGCCGIELEYIRNLREKLPNRIPDPRKR